MSAFLPRHLAILEDEGYPKTRFYIPLFSLIRTKNGDFGRAFLENIILCIILHNVRHNYALFQGDFWQFSIS